MFNHRNRIAMIVAAVGVAFLLVGSPVREAKGDFTLWLDDQLTVNTVQNAGMLYDWSQVHVVSGGSVGRISAFHYSIVDVSGGTVGSGGFESTVYAYDSSTVNISYGSVAALTATNSSTVNICGGSVGGWLNAFNSSTVDISGGSVGGLYARDSSSVDISGGSVGGLGPNAYACDSSSLDMSGGSVSNLYASNSSSVDISGGSISGSLYASDSSTVTLVARNFRLGVGLSLDGDRVLGTGHLGGEWLDGTRWMMNIGTNAPGATILASVPSPGDANGDGLVDVGDLGILGTNYGKVSGATWATADFTGDGAVDVGDLAVR